MKSSVIHRLHEWVKGLPLTVNGWLVTMCNLR